MESKGVLEIYKRSAEKYSIRDNLFMGDGPTLPWTKRSYGVALFVEKIECVNHATKGMGPNLHILCVNV